MSYKQNQTLVFQGKKVRVYTCEMAFEKQTSTYELVEFDTKTGVSILPVTPTGIKLIRHYQLGIDGETWALPTGGLESGEEPATRALLELREETGLTAGKLELMFRSHALPGYIGSQPGYVFAASGLSADPLTGDEPFPIEVKDFSFEEVTQMIRDNILIDTRTMLAILYYQHYKL